MRRSLHALESLQASLSSGGSSSNRLEERRLKEAARVHQLSKLSPYKRAEYVCLECVAELRDALRDVAELQYTLSGCTGPLPYAPREMQAGEANDANDGTDDERAELLGSGDGGGCRRQQRQQRPTRLSGEAALLEQELLRARQRARRAHQQLQQLQRDAARLAQAASTTAAGTTTAKATTTESSPLPSTAVVEMLEWQRAERHVELARQWYRELFGIYTVSSETFSGGTAGARASGISSASSSVLRLNRPAQLHQSAGSMSHMGSGANPLPPGVVTSSGVAPEEAADNSTTSPSVLSQLQRLRSAREDAEFREFFASVQANDDLMDAALDRLSDGLARLLDNARGVQDELATQENLLQVTEQRLDTNAADIATLNRRLRRAIRDMNDSSICVYVVCLLVLLLILGVLLRVAR
jgi:syntaxin of plants SYP7